MYIIFHNWYTHCPSPQTVRIFRAKGEAEFNWIYIPDALPRVFSYFVSQGCIEGEQSFNLTGRAAVIHRLTQEATNRLFGNRATFVDEPDMLMELVPADRS